MTMFHTSFATAALALLVAALSTPAPAQQSPGCNDRTGIRWDLPFERAKTRSVAENRILLIKPIAFGTSADGGW